MKAVQHLLDPTVCDPGARGLCALAIMTKAPRAGQVKTRLVPPLTHEEAAKLNTCFLSDTATAISQACGDIARAIAVYTPVGAEAAYIDVLPADFRLIPQREGAFGVRLALASEDLFRVGYSSVCLIDSDSPTVSSKIYAEAARKLIEPGDRVVLGPSDDGGYYLIGLKQSHRSLFEKIQWSSELVLEQTIARAAQIGVPVHLLPAGFDIDDGASLSRLCTELLAEKSNSVTDSAPATRTFLSQIIAREGGERIWPTLK
jgi:rSAM/selenodomain-associated transferase 1